MKTNRFTVWLTSHLFKIRILSGTQTAVPFFYKYFKKKGKLIDGKDGNRSCNKKSVLYIISWMRNKERNIFATHTEVKNRRLMPLKCPALKTLFSTLKTSQGSTLHKPKLILEYKSLVQRLKSAGIFHCSPP